MFKVILCGAGRRGREHLQFMQQVEGLHLTGIFDISASALQAAQQITNAPGYLHLEPLFLNNAPDIVVIATPPHVRFGLVEQISRYSGIKAVIIEKPLALTVAEARQIETHCQQHGMMPFVFHQLRFCPEFMRLKTATQTGQLGQLQSMHAYCSGNLFDQGSHLLDLMRWLADNRPVEWVMAQGCNDLPGLAHFTDIPPHFTADHVHPGSAWSITTFGLAGGLKLTLHAGLLNPVVQPQVGPWLQKRLVVVGTAGLAEAHSAAYFKLLNGQAAGWQIEESNLASYVQAQGDVYRAVVQTLTAGAPPFQPIHEAIHTLEALEAALESEQQGQLVTVSASRAKRNQAQSRAAASAGNSGRPIVSVIIPMDRHFGRAEAAVTSWTDDQRCLPDDFEVIVLVEPAEKRLAASIGSKLRPQDTLICQTTAGEMEKFHLGATQAKGQILFFTEPHCLAEPETIREIINFYATHVTDGFCGRSSPLDTSKLTARLESRMFTDYFVEWSKPGNWQKAFLRGLALRREIYFVVGGFEYQYGLFAEWLLAATLHRQGYRLDYAPGVGVHHLECENFVRLYDDIKLFVDGECRYRQENDPQSVEQFFGVATEWDRAKALSVFPVSLLLQPLWRQLIHRQGVSASPAGWRESLRQTFHHALLALWGKKQLLLKHQWAVWWAKVRCLAIVWNEEARYRAFIDYYNGLIALFRVQFALAAGTLNSIPGAPGLCYPISELPYEALFGFHGLEIFNKQTFRWSTAVSAIKICLNPDSYQGVITLLHGVRHPAPEAELSLYLNHHPLEVEAFNPETGQLLFNVPKSALAGKTGQWLIIMCKPWQFDDPKILDCRPLGLPVVSVGFRPEHNITANIGA